MITKINKGAASVGGHIITFDEISIEEFCEKNKERILNDLGHNRFLGKSIALEYLGITWEESTYSLITMQQLAQTQKKVLIKIEEWKNDN